jgi:hypothetical protein
MSENQNRRGGTKIEITPEMAEAGAASLMMPRSMGILDPGSAVIARRVYTAMRQLGLNARKRAQ